MTKYKVSSINTGQLLLVLMSIGILVQVNLCIIIKSGFFLKGESKFLFFLVTFYPILILIIWLLFQKFKDKIGVSEIGIESEKYGVIKWEDINFCSWESMRGGNSIFIKLKNKKRITFSHIASQHATDENIDDVKKVFQQIKIYQEGHTFEIKKNRFFYSLGMGLMTFFILSGLIGALIY